MPFWALTMRRGGRFLSTRSPLAQGMGPSAGLIAGPSRLNLAESWRALREGECGEPDQLHRHGLCDSEAGDQKATGSMPES